MLPLTGIVEDLPDPASRVPLARANRNSRMRSALIRTEVRGSASTCSGF